MKQIYTPGAYATNVQEEPMNSVKNKFKKAKEVINT